MNIQLKEITSDNWLACVNLKVHDSQKSYVAPNAFSLAQAAYEANLYPLAIYKEDEMVGFMMYDYDDELQLWGMCRLMIDEKHQKKGYGREALLQLLDLVQLRHGNVLFYTSVEPENKVALKLYEDLGFVNTGKMFYDEILLTKQL
ncbi:GNAT family N-acetyltransferase [Mobilitalea sibirica]|uniref:GNAT family N-acetyltransferase n=1 Tax=Mobilitalea sibirica TaxID=1462919 RepID=A0A8J7H3B9_9FIRM|nr:GNAT family N-acetyltransferase [Mobilitalea sibirica]MBH1941507.1 GNAT family N-acetyltransferase [Mobilitalea sibirica]